MQVSRFSFPIMVLAIAMIFMWQTGQGQQVEIPEVAVLAQPAILQLDAEFYHVPSDSTFFWDRNPIHLKRKNPQGEGLLTGDKLVGLRKALIIQGGKLMGKPSLSTRVNQQASIVLSDPQKKGVFVYLGESEINNDGLTMTLFVGETESETGPDLNDLSDLGLGLSGLWEGTIPRGETLYLVLRSRDPEVSDNYVFFITPKIAD